MVTTAAVRGLPRQIPRIEECVVAVLADAGDADGVGVAAQHQVGHIGGAGEDRMLPHVDPTVHMTEGGVEILVADF